MKKNQLKGALLLLAALGAVLAGVAAGSARLPVRDIFTILFCRLTGRALPERIAEVSASILCSIRLPRVTTAFLVGAALSMSGTVMQSVLRNPLASSYTLGVSSGASLAAAIVIVTGATALWALPTAGFIGGLGTVLAALALASRFDRGLENHTVILVGMVLSLFVNAVLTFVTSLSGEQMNRIVYWQMGSFSGETWRSAAVLAPVTVAGLMVLMRFSREMDLMTFGEEQAMASGVELKCVKIVTIVTASLLTGTAVALAGVIGFVDLIAPHVARKLFGSSHRVTLPVAAVFGGTFMVLSDLAARTLLSPRELPVGAVTAFIGAPFFAALYLKKKRT